MFKYLNILILLLLVFSQGCKNIEEKKKDVQEKEEVEKKENSPKPIDTIKPISLLDSIRSSMHKDYNAHIQRNKPNETIALSQSKDCTLCDMEFLVYLSKKDDYNLNDIKVLLCLDNNDVCDDNAEFVTFYNDMVFKVFNRERRDLSFNQIDSLLQDHELIEELESPTSETNSTTLLDILKSKN